MSAPENIREMVRQRYAAAATRSTAGDNEHALAVETSCCAAAPAATAGEPAGEVQTSCCRAAPVVMTDEQDRVVFGAELYGPDAEGVPVAAVAASLGCGVPTAVADLHPGEVVLDLGSGAGADVLISAGRVAPGGRAVGLDMTDEMLELARRNAATAGVDNVEFLKGYLEDIPLPDGSVDVVISNCVINLAADKNVVLAEAARVLRPGGRLAVSDVIADEDMDQMTKADMAEWTGCIAGALTEAEFTRALTTAGFADIEIHATHRVHTHARAAIIRASLAERPESQPAPSPQEVFKMNRIQVFEPALCCATGVCGEDVDQSLVTFSADMDFVRGQGGEVSRYNLASEPLVFAETEAVKGFLQVVGSKGLPLVLVDGVTAMTGAYPDRAQLTKWAGLTAAVAAGAVPTPAGATMLGLTAAAPTSGGCCSGSEADGCCSTPAGSETAGCC
jgi:ubiquinone/menaquinone biosynthesis C-methylase UbiE